MSHLALPEDILLTVEKPERYIGHEVGAVHKDPREGQIRFALCFPDVYEIGMSHLGIQILYDMFNRQDDVVCERVYSPWPDLEAIMRERSIPLFALESQEPVRDFDFLGITIQFEMCYTNILQVLDLSGIPLHASERAIDDPFVIGGGPCTYNPEPLAPFFDLFYIGEGEVSYRQLLDAFREWKGSGKDRMDFLIKAAKIPGIYVPSLYDVDYHADGTIRSFRPLRKDIPAVIEKQIVMDLDSAVYPERPVIPFLQATQDRIVLEIMRGCMRGCRFCQAGMIYRPLREKSPEHLLELARKMLDASGHEEISLSSLSSSDYSELDTLLTALITDCNRRRINISLPSLRIDAFSLDIMQRVQDVKKSSLTFAPEAGTQRMRDVINKGLTEEEILRGCREAFQGGWNKVKLYFMLGLPTETEEDIRGIAHLCQKVAEEYYEVPKEVRVEKGMGKVAITASSSFFVPKPFTPFQWAAMDTEESILAKASIVKQEVRTQLNQKSIRYTYHHAGISILEGVLARGDRRVAEVIETVYRNGARFDAWSEFFDRSIWDDAFASCGIDPAFYTARERSIDEILPWDFISCGVTKEFLIREWERAKEGVVTPDCSQACSACGAARYGGGICTRRNDR